MWIITQDKKNMVDIRRFQITKNMGGKDKKYVMVGYSQVDGGLSNAVTCAYYPSEDSAYNEFMRLKEFREKTPEDVYQFTD